jgi:hypothetical protein
VDVQELYAALSGGCWSCDAFDRMTDIGLGLADQAFAGLCQPTSALLGLILAIWLVWLAGRFLLPFAPQGATGSLANQGAKRIFWFAVVLAFLQGSQAFWDYVFLPVMAAGVGVAALLASAAPGLSCVFHVPGWGVEGAKAAMKGMDCALQAIQDGFAKGMLTGVAMILGAGWHSWTDFLKVWDWPEQILQALSGLLLAGVHAFGFLLFPLLLIDALLRATIMAVISPLALAASLFRPTARIARKALGNLAQAAFTATFAAVMATIGSAAQTLVYSALPTADGPGLADWDGLIGSLESGALRLSLVDQAYWILLVLGVLVIFMVRNAGKVAAEFAEVARGTFSGATRGVAVLAGASVRAAGQTAATVSRAAVLRSRPADAPSVSRGAAR